MLTPLAGANSDEVARAPSGVMYVTGGVGSEAVDRLKSMEKDFNLKLVFARTSGAYLSDVKLTLVDASGRAFLDITSEGPLLMAKLPPGTIRSTRRLTVTRRPARLRLLRTNWLRSTSGGHATNTRNDQ